MTNVKHRVRFDSLSAGQVRMKDNLIATAGLILDLHPANERRRYKVTPSLIGWAQT